MNRRRFLFSAAAVAAAPSLRAWAARLQSPFRISVINDEISQDFDHACFVAANEFGMSWIELRSMWGKNVTESERRSDRRREENSGQIQSAG